MNASLLFAVPLLVAASGLAATGWSTFQDPFERAFTVDVPQGWTVQGGMFRLGYSDYRPMVDMRSADGRSYFRLGDVAVPSYSMPSGFHAREGETYDLGAQAQMTVAAYRSGQDFVRLYARGRFLGMCQSLTVEDAHEPAAVVDRGPLSPGVVRTSVGEAMYRCQTKQGPRIAYAYARTALYQGLWQVSMLASFMAPPEQAETVRAIARRATESLHLDQQWIRYQQRMDQEGLAYQRLRQQGRLQQLAQQVQQFQARMQSMQSQVRSFERRQDAQAAQVASFGDTLTGLTPAVDPLSGEIHKVWIGPNSGYWINGRGDIVNSNLSPGAGWQAMIH
ncbi:MAG TPA: hypothetical protein VMI94_10555 [Bryobacteraceae bacterium]|nr:hypothetical protein [Bryobacteraceae bacterium]